MSPRLIFTAAAAAIAVHALAEAFTGIEPGVSAEEHLLAGLVPVALLALAAFTFPRVRAGAQAAIALPLGFLALVGFGIAVATLAADGFDLAAATGLLIGPVGLALVALAAGLLWRSRKPGGRPVLRRAGITVLAFLAWFELVVPIAIAMVATHRPAGEVEPHDLGRPYEEVAVPTDDGLELSGWYVPSENGAAVITYPSREGAADHARMLAEAGYGVLAIDARGYGTSEGDPNAFGWEGAADVEAAARFLAAEMDVNPDRIGGLGLSVGGEAMITAAAEGAGLHAVVSDGAGERSVRETLIFGFEAALAIPQAAVQTAATAIFSGDPPPPALDDMATAVSPAALLLIQAGEGQGGEELNAEYFKAAAEPKDLWVVDEAGHTGGIDAEPEEYRERVLGLLGQALGGARGNR